MTQEPAILKKGKDFHKLVQMNWSNTAYGRVTAEKAIHKSNKSRGRADLFVENIGENIVSIVEIKNTDWEKIKPENIQRNVKRQSRQLWEYIEYQTESKGISVSPGIIFPKTPKDPGKLKLIESMFESEFIQVVWENESIEQVKQRMINRSQAK